MKEEVSDRGVKRVSGVTGWSRRASGRASLSNNRGRQLMLNFFCLAMARTSSGSRFQSADPATLLLLLFGFGGDGRPRSARASGGWLTEQNTGPLMTGSPASRSDEQY